jgi:hypothetical protein
MKYYVYQLIDPKTKLPFYIGKGSGERAWLHNEFKDGNNNPYKDRYIKKLYRIGLDPIVDIIKYFNDEVSAYDYEERLTESIGLDKLTNIVIGARPPSKQGWKPSSETLIKRSRGLKGIIRSNEWKENLSKSKQGEKNPMYGKKSPCTEERKIAVLRGKNQDNYQLYKVAITLMDSGRSADSVSNELSIGRGVCFRLKNRTHGIFKAFPELKELPSV